MGIWGAWQAESATRARVAQWRADGALDDVAWQDLKATLGPRPTLALWRGFVEHLSLWLAVALLAAAAICFVAANWEDLGRLARLYGGQLLVAGAALAAWWIGLARAGGQAALLLAALLLGGLLALLGQTYQTGADTWQLFAIWALLLLPWLLAAQSTVMTLLWLAVAHLALLLWLDDIGVDERLRFVLLGLIDLALCFAWRQFGARIDGLRGSLGPRLLAVASLGWLVPAALADVFAWQQFNGLGLLAWAIATAAIAARAWHDRPRDLLLLALAALSLIIVDTALLGRLLFEIEGMATLAFLLLTAAVVGQATWAAARLRALARADADAAEPSP